MSSTAARRTERLIVREVEDETVVYDLDSDMVTVLDAKTAAIWNAADGKASVASVARKLSTSQDEVAVAFVRLKEASLLTASAGMSRRTLLKGVGVGAAVAPLMTVMAPPAFAASSGRTITGLQTNCNNPGNGNVTLRVTAAGYPTGLNAPATGSVTVTFINTSGNTVTTSSQSIAFTAGAGTADVSLTKPRNAVQTVTITVTYNGVTDTGTAQVTGCS